MTIGFDASRAFVKERTGTENYSYQLLKALSKIDHKNQYIVYVRPNSVILNVSEGSLTNVRGNSNKLRDSSPLIGVQNDKWPRNFHFKVINWPRLWTQIGLAKQTFKDSLDVLFVPSHTIPIIRKPGLKTVVTVHDLGSEYLPGMHQLKQRLYLGFMQRQQLKNATKIIAVSKATKQDLIQKIGIMSQKIAVVYEGYDSEKFKVQSAKLKNDSKKYFLFVGTVQPRKNLTRLIQAFSRVILRPEAEGSLTNVRHIPNKLGDFSLITRNDKVNLVIAGGRGWLADQIYALPEKLGIEDQVKFLGRVKDQDLPGLYQGAIALVFPSLFEGFGLPILEAQACGTPVITSNLSSMPEVAGPPAGGGAILVNPYNIDDIVKGMERVKRQAEREKLTKAGLENVKRFSWEKCARETLDVFKSLE